MDHIHDMRKKFFSLLTAVLLLAASGASARTITAMATEPYMEVYVSYSCRARIHDYDSETNMLEVELIVPEIFRGDEVKSLGVGDGITSPRITPRRKTGRTDREAPVQGTDCSFSAWMCKRSPRPVP